MDGLDFTGDAVNNQNSVAPGTVYHTVGDVQVTNRGSSGVLSGVAMDTVYSTVGEKSSRDYSMNQTNNNQPTNTGSNTNTPFTWYFYGAILTMQICGDVVRNVFLILFVVIFI